MCQDSRPVGEGNEEQERQHCQRHCLLTEPQRLRRLSFPVPRRIPICNQPQFNHSIPVFSSLPIRNSSTTAFLPPPRSPRFPKQSLHDDSVTRPEHTTTQKMDFRALLCGEMPPPEKGRNRSNQAHRMIQRLPSPDANSHAPAHNTLGIVLLAHSE